MIVETFPFFIKRLRATIAPESPLSVFAIHWYRPFPHTDSREVRVISVLPCPRDREYLLSLSHFELCVPHFFVALRNQRHRDFLNSQE